MSGNVSLINGHIDDNQPKMTNYEQIKKMNVDEMSDFLMDWFVKCMSGKAPMKVKQWLESEAETE